MSHVDYTTTLLDLEYAEIENIEQNQNSTIVSFHLKRRPHHCPHCNTMLKNWEPYILNAFDFQLSNAFTEGINNSIKVLKRTGFGYRNFVNFRKRILLIHNY